jgi:hypothetical protein
MKNYHFYSLETGVFHNCSVQGSYDSAVLNSPGCHGVLEGFYDANTQQFDLKTQQVVAYQPPAPPSDEMHAAEWDETLQKWIMRPTVRGQWAIVRKERDRLMLLSDWAASKAFECKEDVPPCWLGYRQALRDVTKQPDPFCIEWPVLPNA